MFSIGIILMMLCVFHVSSIGKRGHGVGIETAQCSLMPASKLYSTASSLRRKRTKHYHRPPAAKHHASIRTHAHRHQKRLAREIDKISRFQQSLVLDIDLCLFVCSVPPMWKLIALFTTDLAPSLFLRSRDVHGSVMSVPGLLFGVFVRVGVFWGVSWRGCVLFVFFFTCPAWSLSIPLARGSVACQAYCFFKAFLCTLEHVTEPCPSTAKMQRQRDTLTCKAIT